MDQRLDEIHQRNYEKQDEALIFMLNYDCFMNIFSHLDLLDLYIVAQTCKCFGNLAYDQLKNYKILNTCQIVFKRSHKLINFNSVIKRFGHLLNTLVWSWDLPDLSITQLIPLLSQYCTGIRHLDFHNRIIFDSRETLIKLTGFVKFLESLTLRNCDLTENIGELLEFGINLRNIDLSYNPQLTGKCLINLVNLESLNLSECHNIKETYFNLILKNNTNLKYLNVFGCKELSVDNFENMARNSEELTHLVMSNYYSFVVDNHNLNVVAKIPKLRKLEVFQIGHQPFLMDSLFKELTHVNKLEILIIYGDILTNNALHDLKQFTCLKTIFLHFNSSLDDYALNLLGNSMALEHVSLVGCCNITNKGLLCFIQHCPHLAYLYLVQCSQINLQFFFDAHSYLTSHINRGSRQMAKIKIYYKFGNYNERCRFNEWKGLLESVFEFEMPYSI